MTRSTRQKYNKKQRIYMRDQGLCHYCRVFCNPFPHAGREARDATLDHVLTKAEGGSNKDDNLVLACYACNNGRNCIPYDVFVERTLWKAELTLERESLAHSFSVSMQLSVESKRRK